MELDIKEFSIVDRYYKSCDVGNEMDLTEKILSIRAEVKVRDSLVEKLESLDTNWLVKRR